MKQDRIPSKKTLVCVLAFGIATALSSTACVAEQGDGDLAQQNHALSVVTAADLPDGNLELPADPGITYIFDVADGPIDAKRVVFVSTNRAPTTLFEVLAETPTVADMVDGTMLIETVRIQPQGLSTHDPALQPQQMAKCTEVYITWYRYYDAASGAWVWASTASEVPC
jgi:hypothetical protein